MIIEKKMMKISGILKCIMGVLFLFAPIYGIFLIASGIFLYCLSNEEDEKIYKYNILNLLIGIFGIVDLVGSILQFLNYGKIQEYYSNPINAPPKVFYRLNKEQKKIDILLKLGVLMVFLSGLLFATTSWHFISDRFKVVALVAFGFLFLILSIFVEHRLHLYKSSFMYWLLGNSFLILSLVAILYFEIFGAYISFMGAGRSLSFTITFLAIAGFSLVTCFKYPKSVFLYLFYSSLFIMISYLFNYLQLTPMMIVCVISAIAIVLNIMNQKSKTLRLFSSFLSYVLFAFILKVSNSSDLSLWIACLVNFVNFNYLVFINKDDDEPLLFVIISYILLLLPIYRTSIMGDFNHLVAGLSISLYSLVVFADIIPVLSKMKKYLFSFYAILMSGIILTSFNHYTSIVLAILFLGIIEVLRFGWFDFKPVSISLYCEPLTVFLLMISLVGTIFSKDFDISFLYGFSISSIIYCFLHYFYKDIHIKKLYSYLGIVAVVFALTINIECLELMSTIMLMISSLYLFIYHYFIADQKENGKILSSITYCLLLLSVYSPFVASNILQLNDYFVSFMMIILIIVMIIILRDSIITKISCFAIILPLSHMMDVAQIDYALRKIFGSIIGLYCVLLVLLFFLKDNFIRNIITIISLVVFLSDLFFLDSVYVNVYIGIIGLITIIIGYHKNDFYPMFIAGIILTVVNIINSLRDVWKLIPFWLYLLVGGLAIIGFVTVREIKKQSKKSSSE